MIPPEYEKLLRDFDHAWQAGKAPPLADVLAAVPPESRRSLLQELISIDIEYRWQKTASSPPPRLEEYAAEFSELGPAAQLPLELIAHEYEVRHSWGDRPPHAEYLARFPAQADALQKRLMAADQELTTEYADHSARSRTAASMVPARPSEAKAAPPITIAALAEALTALPVLSPEQRQEVAADWAARYPEPGALVQELLHRAWLTAYQAGQLLLGRGTDLVVGSYLLLERLGEGGTGQVFKARHLQTGQIAAVKVIRMELLADLEVVTRFRREVRVLRELRHPNIVGAYDTDDAGSALLLAMEYVEGTDLSKLVKQHGPLPVATACDYIRQAAIGLQYAHEKGLVHRDIKPSNLLVSLVPGPLSLEAHKGPGTTDNGQIVKILDLGLARLRRSLDGDATHTLAESSLAATMTPIGCVMMGTPDYMAPEQALDFHRADIRSDIYSLGCTFYFLLAGRPPFIAANLAAKLLQHQQGEPTPLNRVRPEVSPGVAALVHRMLAKDPRQRPQTPADVVTALEKPDARPPRTGWRRWSTVVARTAAAAALLGLGWLLFAGPRTSAEKNEPPDSTVPDSSAAQQALQALRGRAAEPDVDRASLRRELIAFRSRFPGSPEAVEAADLLARLPSPLDQLDPKAIPLDERLPNQPAQLVAILGRRHFRHRGTVEAAVFSPDGRLLATSGSNDGVVHLWDTATWQERAAFRAPAAQVPSLAWSPDGKTLAAGFETTLRLWDVTGKEHDPPLRGHGGPILRLAYSRDGALLASASADRTVRLWDTATGKERQLLTGHTQSVTALAWSSDDKVLVTGSTDKTIKVWDPATARVLHELPVQPGPVYALAFAPDGQLLASGCDDGRVQLWDPHSWQARKVLPHRGGAVRSLAFLDQGKTLLSGGRDGKIKFWDVASGKQKTDLHGHTGYINCLALDPDQPRLVSGGADGTLRIWDLAKGADLFPGTGHAGSVYAVGFSPDGTRLASGGIDYTVRVWDPAAATELQVLTGHGGPVFAVAFDLSGERLASGSYDGTLRLWDAATFRPVGQTNSRAAGFISSVAIAPDGRTVAMACQHGPIRLCDLTTWKDLAVLPGHKSGVDGVAFAPDGRSLASGGVDGTTKVWGMPGGKELASLQSRAVRRVRAVAYAPDGRLLAAANTDGSVSLWDLRSLREKTAVAGHTGDVFALAFSPNGRVLATAGTDGRLIFWDPSDMSKLEEILLPASVHSLAFTPDGRHLATANSNGTVYLVRLK
jgi:WD40 repeat protein/serine/threonine protein kinase